MVFCKAGEIIAVRPKVGWFAGIVLLGVVGAGVFTILWTAGIKFEGCAVEELNEARKAAVAELVDIVKWSLTLSAGFVGLFGSLILGLKEGPKLTPAAWTLLFTVVCCFSFAAYFALVWRTGLAEALFNGCTDQIATGILQFTFDALTYFFAAGLIILATILALVARQRMEG